MAKFGYVDFNYHRFVNSDEIIWSFDDFRKELLGKTISEKTIQDTLDKMDYCTSEKTKIPLKVFLFSASDGIALIGENGKTPYIEITWKVPDETTEQLKLITGLLTEIVANLNTKS